MSYFADKDFESLWRRDARFYERVEFPNDAELKSIEARLGYRLPQSYLWLMRCHNGGEVVENNHSIEEINSVQALHDLIDFGMIAGDETYSGIGLVFAITPYGHDCYLFDYRNCDINGEPEIAYFDNEAYPEDQTITKVAANFEEFMKTLTWGDDYVLKATIEPDSTKRRNTFGCGFVATIYFGGLVVLIVIGFLLRLMNPRILMFIAPLWLVATIGICYLHERIQRIRK